MQITSIDKQIKNPERFDIYIDNNYSFSLDYEDLAQSGIKVDDYIDPDFLSELIYLSQYKKAYNKALKFLTARARSCYEVTRKLSILKYDNKVIEDVVQKLTDLGYINDEEFSKQWAEDRKNLKRAGKKKVIAELINKGINYKTAEDAVNQCQTDDLKIAESLLEKKLKGSIDPDNIKAFNKIYRYLLSKGIEYDTARRAIERFMEINRINK